MCKATIIGALLCMLFIIQAWVRLMDRQVDGLGDWTALVSYEAKDLVPYCLPSSCPYLNFLV